MDTIKKKMMAMKNEKDTAMDRAEQLEQNLKDTETAKSEVGLLYSRVSEGGTERSLPVEYTIALFLHMNGAPR